MSRPSSLRIAMIGCRGVPATWGGIERHVEELGARLVEQGHEVTVFCRPGYTSDRPATYRGMRLKYVPTVSSKHLDAIVHSVVSAAAALRGSFDVVHYHGVGPGLAAPITRLASRARVVLTVHGLDGDRAKWGPVAATVLRTATWMSARVPHATVVVSSALRDHYARRYGRRTHFIPNGVPAATEPRSTGYVDRLRLGGRPYVLFVGRFVPEKAPDLLIRAFRDVPGDVRLVLAGGSSFTDDFAQRLKELAAQDERVLLPGYVYGEDLEELYRRASLFVLPSDLEGLPLTLLEAIGHGAPVLASSIPPHVEVLGEGRAGGRLFASGDREGLVRSLVDCLAEPDAERAGAVEVRRTVIERFSWDAATESLVGVYHRGAPQ